MYEDFYGLSGKPFHLSPDPRFFFESKGHARALAYLRYGVEQHEGFVVVTGDVGTGKTTLARILYEELRSFRDIRVAQVSVPNCDANELMEMVTDAFDIDHERHTRASLLNRVFEFLRARRAEGEHALLLVDEVQNLPAPALETLRTLSNLQVDDQALLQIILLGQAEFRDTLNAPTLRQLRQRVIASCHLQPFSDPAETRAYIGHRLRQVGWDDDPHFSDDALDSVHAFTDGIPRRINTFCDRLLLFAFLEEQHRIEADTVAAVIEEIASEFPVARAADDAEPASSPPVAAASDEQLTGLEARVGRLEDMLEEIRVGLERDLSEQQLNTAIRNVEPHLQSVLGQATLENALNHLRDAIARSQTATAASSADAEQPLAGGRRRSAQPKS